MITLCEQKDHAISMVKEEADQLTDYSVDIRYPDSTLFIDVNEAKEAINIAMKVKEYVLSKIAPQDH